jgi:hypothetical protein
MSFNPNRCSQREQFEKWMIEKAKIIIGSNDPYPKGLERDYWKVWQASSKVAQARIDELTKSNHKELLDHYAETNDFAECIATVKHLEKQITALEARNRELVESLDRILKLSQISPVVDKYGSARFETTSICLKALSTQPTDALDKKEVK